LRKAVVVLTLLVLAAALAGPAATGVTPTPQPVKTTTANEQNPAASTAWFAWTQSSTDHPTRTNVRAEPAAGGSSFRVNPDGTRAWTGGIAGTRLVYQQIKSGDSNIRLFDLANQTHFRNPEVNTDRWEWHPTISTERTDDGDTWIMFGRQNVSTLTQKIIAYNVNDDMSVVLEETSNGRYSLIPGQVNGDWATWTACKPNCNVRYRNLVALAPKETVRRPDFVRHQYGSSIAEDGTLYYARSGSGCGANVRIMRNSAGVNQLLVDFPDHRDLFFTYVDDQAGNEVYYDRVGCGAGTWNIYQVID
jgi:hypothetical protein